MSSPSCRTSFDPAARDIALDIDIVARSVCIQGRRYQFDSQRAMERFLTRLWDSKPASDALVQPAERLHARAQ